MVFVVQDGSIGLTTASFYDSTYCNCVTDTDEIFIDEMNRLSVCEEKWLCFYATHFRERKKNHITFLNK